MSIWYLCASARPKSEAEDCLQAWLDFGCRVMILRQGEPLNLPITQYPVSFYAGNGVSGNHLIKTVLQINPTAPWFALGGDDYYPDMRHRANTVALECTEHFQGTLGVMQPTGDRYGEGYIDTAAASPWIGAQFCERAYGGRGPLFEDYFHLYMDTELQKVAEIYKAFWQRPDIYQEHKHWTRGVTAKPAFADDIYGELAVRDKALYEARLSANFPGHALLTREADYPNV